MKKLITVLAALAVSVNFALAADAEKPKAEKGEKGEKKGNPEELFKKLDTDGDGKLSADELKAGPMGKKDPAHADEVLKRKDKDGDGKLSLDEFKAGGGKKDGDKKGEKKPEGAPTTGTEKKSDAGGPPAEKK